MKTAEEYLQERMPSVYYDCKEGEILSMVCHAMEKYATQQVAAATADIKRERDEYYDTLQQHRVTIAEMQRRIEELEKMVPKQSDLKHIIDETTEAHPYRQRGKPETYSDYNQGWEDACDILGDRIIDAIFNHKPLPQSPTAPTGPTGHGPDNSDGDSGL